jgi:hypothetical protein
MLLEKK